jgi:hypothetical protein
VKSEKRKVKNYPNFSLFVFRLKIGPLSIKAVFYSILSKKRLYTEGSYFRGRILSIEQSKQSRCINHNNFWERNIFQRFKIIVMADYAQCVCGDGTLGKFSIVESADSAALKPICCSIISAYSSSISVVTQSVKRCVTRAYHIQWRDDFCEMQTSITLVSMTIFTFYKVF